MSNDKGLAARSTWIAGFAGVGWLLSGALNGWLVTRPGLLPVSFVQLLFPETIALVAWRTVDIWPVFLALVSTLTFMLFTVCALLFVGPLNALDPAHRRIRFFATWMCIVVASFATSVLSALGELIANWPPPRLTMLFQGVDSDLLAAGYWGIFWGWLPVVAGTLVARQRPDGVGRRKAFGMPGLLVAVAAIFMAATLVIAIPQAHRETKARAAFDPPVTAPPASPEPDPIGSPSVSYATQPAGTDWCDGKDLSLTVSEPDGATGHRAMRMGLTNAGAASCVLESYPDLAFDNVDGWAIDVLVVHGGSFMTDDPGVARVTLAPGQGAEAFMGWNAMASAGDTRVGNVLVAPYAGTLRQNSTVDLDIVDRGTVSVTAWQKAGKTVETSPYPGPND